MQGQVGAGTPGTDRPPGQGSQSLMLQVGTRALSLYLLVLSASSQGIGPQTCGVSQEQKEPDLQSMWILGFKKHPLTPATHGGRV